MQRQRRALTRWDGRVSTPAGFRSTLWTAMDAHARNRTSPRSGFPQTVPRQRRCPETVTTTRICSEPMGGQWAFVWKGSRSQDREPSLIRAVKTVVGCFRPRWTLPGLKVFAPKPCTDRMGLMGECGCWALENACQFDMSFIVVPGGRNLVSVCIARRAPLFTTWGYYW